MQENQNNSSRFSEKINSLRQKVLKLDGVEAVDGISDDIYDHSSKTPVLHSKFAGELLYTSQEKG